MLDLGRGKTSLARIFERLSESLWSKCVCCNLPGRRPQISTGTLGVPPHTLLFW